MSKSSIQAILRGHITTFFKYVFFFLLVISEFFHKNKLLILLMITPYKNFCKNSRFPTNYSTVLTKFYCLLKIEKNLNLIIFVFFSFLQFSNNRGTFLKLSETDISSAAQLSTT